MIYKITIRADAIDEDVTTSAESEEQARERAVYSVLQRQIQAAIVIVEEGVGMTSDDVLAELRSLVKMQAEDEGLWFVAQTAPEAYLQQELRRLHQAVERV